MEKWWEHVWDIAETENVRDFFFARQEKRT